LNKVEVEVEVKIKVINIHKWLNQRQRN